MDSNGLADDLRAVIAELRELVGRLLRRIAELEGRERQHLRRIGRIAQLESRLRRDSSTSSRPPSSDGPWSKRRGRRRPPSDKKQGAQPGHPGKTRNLVDPGDVDEIVDHEPSACRTCGHVELVDGGIAPRRHQVTEIPPLLATITEHRLRGRLCGHCGDAVFADLPEGVSPSAFGPRLQALVVTLVAAYRLSRAEAARLLSEAFDVKISVGSVSNIERRMSRALEPLRGTAALPLHNVRPLLPLVRLVQRGTRVSPCWTTISRCFGSKRPEVQILSPRPRVTIAARASYGDFARPIRTPRFRPIPATAALPLQIVTRPTGAIDAVRWRSPSSAWLQSPYWLGVEKWGVYQRTLEVMKDYPALREAVGPYVIFVSVGGSPRKDLADVDEVEMNRAQRILRETTTLFPTLYDGWHRELGPLFDFKKYGPDNAEFGTLLKIHAFSREKDFERFNRQYYAWSPRMAGVCAFYSQREPRFIVTHDGRTHEEPYATYQTQCHEGVHQLIHFYTRELSTAAGGDPPAWDRGSSQPLWSSEGFAEFFSAYAGDGDARRWMQPLDSRMELIWIVEQAFPKLQWSDWSLNALMTPLDGGELDQAVLGVSPRLTRAQAENERWVAWLDAVHAVYANLYYARAWSLVYFLWYAEELGQPKYRDRFVRYLEREWVVPKPTEPLAEGGIWTSKLFYDAMGITDRAGSKALEAEWKEFTSKLCEREKTSDWLPARFALPPLPPLGREVAPSVAASSGDSESGENQEHWFGVVVRVGRCGLAPDRKRQRGRDRLAVAGLEREQVGQQRERRLRLEVRVVDVEPRAAIGDRDVRAVRLGRRGPDTEQVARDFAPVERRPVGSRGVGHPPPRGVLLGNLDGVRQVEQDAEERPGRDADAVSVIGQRIVVRGDHRVEGPALAQPEDAPDLGGLGRLGAARAERPAQPRTIRRA